MNLAGTHNHEEPTSFCIGCGCDDDHACVGGCQWLKVDVAIGRGVCSRCPDEVRHWDLERRHLSRQARENIIDTHGEYVGKQLIERLSTP